MGFNIKDVLSNLLDKGNVKTGNLLGAEKFATEDASS